MVGCRADRGASGTHNLKSLAFSAAGSATGTIQWLVLRRWVSRSGWWVLASIVSWVGVTYVYASLTRANAMH